jgi:NodT family efflux transporter outer membrane factor (OMF) lipoprotein
MSVQSNHHKLLTLAAASCMALSGCVVGPNYKGPPLVAPDAVSAGAFRHAEQAHSDPPPSTWWLAMGDPQLNHLIDDAFAASPDVEAAVARLRQSRATLGKDRANLFPTTGSSAAYLQSKGLTSAISGGSTGQTSSYSASQSSDALNVYEVGLDATWQLDLFGARRRAVEGDIAATQAVQANLEDAEVSLAAEVAQDYVTLRDLQQRLALTEQNIAVESRMLALTEVRRRGGDASDLDVERMLNQLRSTQAQGVPLKAQIVDQLDRLAILTGRAPGDLDKVLEPVAPVPLPPKVVAVGDPASLLRLSVSARAIFSPRSRCSARSATHPATCPAFSRPTAFPMWRRRSCSGAPSISVAPAPGFARRRANAPRPSPTIARRCLGRCATPKQRSPPMGARGRTCKAYWRSRLQPSARRN